MDKLDISNRLFSDIKQIIEQGKQQVSHAINVGVTATYWNVGKRINEDILNNERAEYGKQILQTLSAKLIKDYGSGYSMYLTEIVFVNKKRNSLVRYNRKMFPFFGFDRESENILWAVAGDNRIMHFIDFNSVPDTNAFTFNMKTMEGRKGEFTDYWQFRKKLVEMME